MTSFDPANLDSANSDRTQQSAEEAALLSQEFCRVVAARARQQQAPEPSSMWGGLRSRIERVANALADYLLGAGSEVVIRQRYNRAGQKQWTLYDPKCDRCYQFSSERALRVWLESRFSR